MKTYNIFLILGLCIQLLKCQYNWTIIDEAVLAGINGHAYPGAVIAVCNTTHVLFQKPYGSLTYGPQIYSTQTRNDTKYDASSITKIMATTYDIMNLVSSKSISLDDYVSKYIENYQTSKKGNTTIKNLLLHNAGLPYDYPGTLPKSQQEVIDYLRFLKPITPVGSKYQYSNLGFLLLGKIIEKVRNQTFEKYTSLNHYYAGLKDTNFNPDASEIYRIAPIEFDIQIKKQIIRGEVHEKLTELFKGVAGHWGLFTTAPDLLRFIRLLLNKGKFPQQLQLIPANIVQQFTTVVSGLEYDNTRSYGFDGYCPSIKMSNCFGHDSTTGVSAWGDKSKNIGFVIMTNRGHPDLKNNLFFTHHRNQIINAIMKALGY